jgi:hypothetical protein
MRWFKKPRWCEGGRRTRRGFLLLPKLIGNEWRWLVFARWLEEYTIFTDGFTHWYEWAPIRWLDKED